MPSTTPRLGLTKPFTSEIYNIAIHNTNMDLIDAAPAGAIICTSVTRPSSPDDGDFIYETDSGNVLVRQGGSWRAANGKVFLCTVSTRPASGLSFAGMMIFEQDTGNRLIRNITNASWEVLSPYRVDNAAARTALGNLADGFIVIQLDDFSVWAHGGTSDWYRLFGGSVTHRISSGFGTTGSTTYTSTLTSGAVAGVAFTAPAGGRVRIANSVYMFSSATSGQFCSIRVGTGSTVGAGTEILAPLDSNACINTTTDGLQMEKTYLLEGLTAGSSYNVQQRVRTVSGTATFNHHALVISPA